MLKNYITETYLHQFCPEPELDAYLWNGETTYDDQKSGAEQIVLNDFVNRGYNVRLLRPELTLDVTDEVEDIASRNRCVVVCSAFTSTATITVTGANDPEDTFVSCGSGTVTATGTSSFLLSSLYRYYKYTISGTATVTVSLIETNYDLFYAYKWLSLILQTARGQAGDIYDTKKMDFDRMYEELFASAKLWLDKDEDGTLITEEHSNNGVVRLTR